ncbi:MAG: hypothetical protein HQK49_17595 [Oligoflexia bacterium]|nr:hypothetical protein [Oligoflexia bacterium]
MNFLTKKSLALALALALTFKSTKSTFLIIFLFSINTSTIINISFADTVDAIDSFVQSKKSIDHLDEYRIPVKEIEYIKKIASLNHSTSYKVTYNHTDMVTKKSIYQSFYYFHSLIENSNHDSDTTSDTTSNTTIKKATVIILPPIITINPVDYVTCHYFAKKGYNTIFVPFDENVRDLSFTLADINKIIINYMVKVKEIIDLSSQLEGVDANKIIIVGQSMGGVFASLVFNSDIRLKALVTSLAGANFPEIFTYGQQSIVKRFRKHKLKELDIDLDEFKSIAEKEITVDTANNPYKRGPKNILMFIDQKDNGVPTKNQFELWEIYQKPQVNYLYNGHSLSAFTFNFLLTKIVNFLDNISFY